MSRIGQPELPPIVFEGRKYSQIMNGAALDLAQRTGYVSVVDVSEVTLLAIIRIYDVELDGDNEEDIQDVFFTAMDLDAENRRIIIENENGGEYALDLDGWSVSTLD